MLLQLLADICHVLNAELKQKEKSNYVSHYNIIINEVYEDEYNIIHDDIKIEKA